jgi:hypothetical protein
MARQTTKPTTYQLRITLLGIDPPIWRRIQVTSTFPLASLHDSIQAVMGWTDSHLHGFEKDGKHWGVPETDEFGDLKLIDERKVPVGTVLKAEGDVLRYEYDFGDSWVHDVLLEKIVPSEAPPKPHCLGGARRCPPEDVGGPHGYQEFLDAIFDPQHEEFDHYRQWAGGPFDAEEFHLQAVNYTLERMRWPGRRRR